MKDENLDLENFISGDVFNYGINSSIVDKELRDDDKKLNRTFLILYNSTEKEIVAASKILKNMDFSLEADSNRNGASLTIKLINNKYTKNYVPENKNYIADGFALIDAEPLPEEKVDDPNSDEMVQFPNFDKPYSILLKGELEDKPYFSKGTKFIFNPSTINFGVINEN